MPPPVFFLMGPTASGKTAAAASLAEQFPFEVISVDSSLVYRRMDIGTAKPDPVLLERVPHHLVDIREPWETYSAAEFAAAAVELIDDIIGRGALPLCVGGTMFYFRALEFGLPAMPPGDASIRARLCAQGERLGWPVMHQRLRARDPRRADQIEPNDRQRIQRALELLELTDRPISPPAAAAPRYQVQKIALVPWRRRQLHERIERRFAAMLARGLVEEVRDLLRTASISRELPAMRMVGYRQVTQYLQGEVGYNEMLQRGVAATRQLAKRQLTWLRNQRGVTWIDDDTAPDWTILRAYVDGKLRHGGQFFGVS